jgi:YegS/Rv2252/BmrU family lipid kinase
MPDTQKWFAIVNPASGFGKVRKEWRAISHELVKQEVPFDFEFTIPECKGDEIAHKAIANGYRKLICVGGDGHLHDIVNGIMTQHHVPSTDVTIGMISQGTGNDWIKTNGIPKNIKQAISIIKQGKTYVQNAGLAESYRDGQPVRKYFHNFAGVGFDAYVVQNTLTSKGYGQIAYLLVMLRSLFSYQKPVLRITLDDRVIETPVYLTLSGLGKYGGGGMKLTPDGKPDGDAFNVSVAKDFSKSDVFRYIGKLYDGSFIHLDKSESHMSRHIRIEVISSAEEVYMEADGDMMGTGPFEISLVPHALRVVIP